LSWKISKLTHLIRFNKTVKKKFHVLNIFFIFKKNPTDSISLEKYISVCMAWENGVEDDAKKRHGH
jgi:hypothetical protein